MYKQDMDAISPMKEKVCYILGLNVNPANSVVTSGFQ